MKRALTSLSLLACVALFLAACSTTVKLGGVVVSVSDLKPVASTPQGTEIGATMTYANENVLPIGVSEADHKLYLDGTYVGKTLKIEPIGLPQLASASQPVIFKIEKPEVVARLARSGSARAVPYRIVSQLRSLSGEDKVQIVTANVGTLDLTALAK